MLNKRTILLVVLCVALLVGLFGCSEDTEDLVEVKENLEGLTFEWGGLLKRAVYVDTESKSYKFYLSSIEFYQSENNQSYFVYNTDSDGEFYERKIYLGKADLKKYSKSYVEKFRENFMIISSEKQREEE